VKLLIVSHPLEQRAEGWLFFQVRCALAEYERAKILERTKRGMLGCARPGHVHGAIVPLGYRYVAGDHYGHVEIDEDEAAVVRTIFDLCLQGMAAKSIARRLTDARIPTRRDRHPTSGSRKSCGVGVWNHDGLLGWNYPRLSLSRAEGISASRHVCAATCHEDGAPRWPR
jgi:hypothetical protein